MSETKQVPHHVHLVGLSDFAFCLFLIASVVTCGWAPNCADERNMATGGTDGLR